MFSACDNECILTIGVAVWLGSWYPCYKNIFNVHILLCNIARVKNKRCLYLVLNRVEWNIRLRNVTGHRVNLSKSRDFMKRAPKLHKIRVNFK